MRIQKIKIIAKKANMTCMRQIKNEKNTENNREQERGRGKVRSFFPFKRFYCKQRTFIRFNFSNYL